MKRSLLLSAIALLLLGAAEAPLQPKVLPPAEAAKQGQALAADLLAGWPAQNVTNSGVMRITSANRRLPPVEVPVEFRILSSASHWQSEYRTITPDEDHAAILAVVHSPGQTNQYQLARISEPFTNTPPSIHLSGNQTMTPFAGSDFWVADLGLEFFHWPEQRLVKTEMRRGRSCRVLESINPGPAPAAYSRVLSWIDMETGGIVRAEAYDFKNKLLKEFNPKRFKKIQGHWELQEMEIENTQTGSRTRIEFNLGAHAQ